MMSMEVLEQRREGPIASSWASNAAWEVTRAVSLLRKSFRTPKKAG